MLPKLSPPNPPRLLLRSRLHRRLDEGCGSVIWITAPAGAGKTSLVAGWCRTRREPRCWIRIERADRDPATFFHALARAVPARDRQQLPVFEPEHFLDLGGFTQRYLRAWFGAFDPQTLIVLDNLHEAADPDGEPAWFLSALVIERPPALTLVISSRLAPDGALLRLALDPGHVRLDYGELRCDDDEAAQLAQRLGLAPPDQTLLARADGWIAGVSLLLRTGTHQSDLPGATARDRVEGERALFATFASQAFEALPASSQDLLLAHAFSPCIRPDAADRLLGVTGSHRALQALWQAQFFVERRTGSDGRTAFVCHPLLRAFLQDRVRQRWSPTSLAALWRRQAREFEAAGEHDAAIELWLQAEDREAVARLLLDKAPKLLNLGYHDNWLDWLDRLGEVPARHRGALAYWEGKFLLLRAPARALVCQQRAREAWIAEGNVVGQLLAVCAILDATFARWQHWDAALPWVDEAHRLYLALGTAASPATLPPDVSDPSDLSDLSGGPGGGPCFAGSDAEYEAIASGYSVLQMHPGHPLLALWYERACHLLGRATWGDRQLAVSTFVMCHAWWHGHIHRLRDVSRQALHAIRNTPDRLATRLAPLLWVVTAGNVDGLACDAERHAAVDLLVDVCEASGIRALQHHAWMRVMHMAMTRQDARRGSLAWSRIEALDTKRRTSRGLTVISRLLHEQLQGNWTAAIDLSQRALADEPAIRDWTYGRCIVRVELAQLRALVGDHDQARAQGRDLLALSTSYDNRCLEIVGKLVLAHAELARGELAIADGWLREGLGLARAQGYLALPCGPPTYLAALAARALEADIEPAWVRQMVHDQKLPAPSASLPGWPYPVRIQVLGPFRLVIDGVALTHQGRAQQRVLELLKALAAHGGTAVPLESLATRLWPESDAAASQAALDIALHRARRLLGDSACLIVKDGRLSLNPAFVDLDLWRMRRHLDRIMDVTTPTPRAAGPAADPERATVLTALARSFARDFPASLLPGDRERGWLLELRRTWRAELEGAAQVLATACLATKQTSVALDLIECALEEYPGSKTLTHLHAKALASLGPLPELEARAEAFDAKASTGKVKEPPRPALR